MLILWLGCVRSVAAASVVYGGGGVCVPRIIENRLNVENLHGFERSVGSVLAMGGGRYKSN